MSGFTKPQMIFCWKTANFSGWKHHCSFCAWYARICTKCVLVMYAFVSNGFLYLLLTAQAIKIDCNWSLWTQGGCVYRNIMNYLIYIPWEVCADYSGTVQNLCQRDLIKIIWYIAIYYFLHWQYSFNRRRRAPPCRDVHKMFHRLDSFCFWAIGEWMKVQFYQIWWKLPKRCRSY